MENPLRSTAASDAKQGSVAASRATTAAQRPIWIGLFMLKIRKSPISGQLYPLPRLTTNYFRDRRGYAAAIVAQGDAPPAPAQLLAGIPHDNRMPRKLKHFHVVMVVTDGHDLFAPVTAMRSPAFQRMALGAARIQHVNHGEIALRIFGAQHRDSSLHSVAFKRPQRLAHPRHGAAKHGLYGIFDQRFLERNDEVDVGHILLQPTPDAGVQLVEMFEHNCAL